jgi:hypothetical protein
MGQGESVGYLYILLRVALVVFLRLNSATIQWPKIFKIRKENSHLGWHPHPHPPLHSGPHLQDPAHALLRAGENVRCWCGFSTESVAFRGHGSIWRETPRQKGSRPSCILPLCSASATAPTLAVIAALSASSLATVEVWNQRELFLLCGGIVETLRDAPGADGKFRDAANFVLFGSAGDE